MFQRSLRLPHQPCQKVDSDSYAGSTTRTRRLTQNAFVVGRGGALLVFHRQLRESLKRQNEVRSPNYTERALEYQIGGDL